MNALSFLPVRWRGFFAASLLFLATGGGGEALAQVVESDPPGRVARLNHAEGTVSVAAGDAGAWGPAELNRPLTTGDRVWTEQGARSELHVGSTALRLDSQTSLDFMQLDDQVAQLRMTQGRVKLRVRQLWDGERLEVDTPNIAFVVNQPGDYRIEVDPARNVTRVAVASGAGTVYGEGGESVQLGAGRQLALTARNLSQVGGQDMVPNDAFDLWADARDQREEQSISARYVSRETIGYQQLDTHGQWQTDPTYGPVWYPNVTIVDWAPYRYGQWRWIAPWGWTWVDDAPWGFAPFHYGRWAQIGPRWCWVPGPVVRRPIYAPALVGFSGGSGAVHWSIGASSGRPNVGWFPLGPGEAWRPGYRASSRYIDNINRPAIIHRGSRQPGYVHQNRPGAVTAVPSVEFDQRRPVRAHWNRERGPDFNRGPDLQRGADSHRAPENHRPPQQAVVPQQPGVMPGREGRDNRDGRDAARDIGREHRGDRDRRDDRDDRGNHGRDRDRGGVVIDSGRADPGHRPWRGVAPAPAQPAPQAAAPIGLPQQQPQQPAPQMRAEPSPPFPQGQRAQAMREQMQRQQQPQVQAVPQIQAVPQANPGPQREHRGDRMRGGPRGDEPQGGPGRMQGQGRERN